MKPMPTVDSFVDLIQQSVAMLSDRPKIERDLIYSVAALSNEERNAIRFAYKILKEDANDGESSDT